MRIPLRSGNNTLYFSASPCLIWSFKNENSFEEWKPYNFLSFSFFLLSKFKNENSFEEWKPGSRPERVVGHTGTGLKMRIPLRSGNL